jgi:hypothetical protein
MRRHRNLSDGIRTVPKSEIKIGECNMRLENARGKEVEVVKDRWEYVRVDSKNFSELPCDCNAVEGTECFNLSIETCAYCCLMFEIDDESQTTPSSRINPDGRGME